MISLVLMASPGKGLSASVPPRPEDGLPGHAHDVGDDVVQLHIHLRHRLLQMLDMARLIGQQHVTVTPHGTQRADFLSRTETAPQKPITHELL